MSGTQFIPPRFIPVNGSGRPYPGAKLYFYEAGTTTLATVYTTSALAVESANPLTASASGMFDAVYLDPASTTDYKAVLKNSAGAQIWSEDNIPARSITASSIGLELYPRSAAEISASVTPTAYEYPWLDVRRYGAVGDGVANDTTALQAACNVAAQAGGGTVFLPSGVYLTTTTITLGNYVILQGESMQGSKIQGTGATTVVTMGTRSAVRDVWLRGDATAASKGIAATAAAIHWQAQGVRITNCDIGVYLNNTFIVSLRDCVIQSCTTYGLQTGTADINAIYIDGGEIQGCGIGAWIDYCNGVFFDGVTIEGNTTYGAAIASDSAYDVSFTNCYFEANGDASITVPVTTPQVIPRSISVHACVFSGTTDYCIDAAEGVEWNISGNTFKTYTLKAMRFAAAVDRAYIGANYYSGTAFDPATDYAGTNLGEWGKRIATHGTGVFGAATPHAKAILQADSTTLGFLPPRMTGTQRDAISTPPAGLVIFNTTTNKLNVYGGSGWEAVTSA